MIAAKRQRHWRSALVAVVAIVVVGVSLTRLTYAASGSLSLNPASSSATVGSDLVVAVHENSGSDAAIGVTATIDFSSNLQFVSASTVAPFTVAPPDNVSGNVLSITRGAYSNQTGDQLVSVLTFKVTAAGTGSLTFDNAQSSIAPASGSGNLMVNSAGGSYSLTSASGSSSSSSSSTPPSTSTTTPALSAPSANSKATSVSVTPAAKTSASSSSSSSASNAVTVPDNGSVAVATPVDVQPATVQTDGVKKVAYYLKGKLVDTETKAPYTYHVNTQQLKNGTYTLVSKTYYTNGMVKQATQHLVVNNTAAHTSNLAWFYLLAVAVIILLGLGFNIFRPRGGGPPWKLFRHQGLAPATVPASGTDDNSLVPPVNPGPPATATPAIAPPPVTDTVISAPPAVVPAVAPPSPPPLTSPTTIVRPENIAEQPAEPVTPPTTPAAPQPAVGDRLEYLSGPDQPLPGSTITPDKT